MANRLWRNNNKAKHIAYNKQWEKENPEKVKKHRHKSYAKHKARHFARHKKWVAENPEKEKAIKARAGKRYRSTLKGQLYLKQWREHHPEEIKKYQRKSDKKIRDTIEGKLNYRISSGIRKSLRKHKKRNHWEGLVGYTTKDLKKHLENQFTVRMNWSEFLKGKIHIDHIQPKSSFHFSSFDDEDFKKCWSLSNLQPLWAKDNLQKHNKIVQAA